VADGGRGPVDLDLCALGGLHVARLVHAPVLQIVDALGADHDARGVGQLRPGVEREITGLHAGEGVVGVEIHRHVAVVPGGRGRRRGVGSRPVYAHGRAGRGRLVARLVLNRSAGAQPAALARNDAVGGDGRRVYTRHRV